MAAKGEPKNPARVDAALRTHLRRMDRQVRSGTLFVAAVSAVVFLLLVLQPLRPRQTAVLVPFGVVTALLAGLSLFGARDRRNATRRKLMRTCRTCGYDLRGTADACPECGSPIPDELRRAREAGKDRQYLDVTKGNQPRQSQVTWVPLSVGPAVPAVPSLLPHVFTSSRFIPSPLSPSPLSPSPGTPGEGRGEGSAPPAAQPSGYHLHPTVPANQRPT